MIDKNLWTRFYGYEAYTVLWYVVSSEELYNYFNSTQ